VITRRHLFAVFTCVLAAFATTAQTAEVDGPWHFVINTDDGTRDAAVVIHSKGQALSGTWNGDEVPEMGTFKDGALDLSFRYNSDELGVTDTLSLKGKLADGKLSGRWSFTQYAGTFVATRSTAEKP
jgi:hypothetical protein